MSLVRTLQRFFRFTKRGSDDARGSLKAFPLDILLLIIDYLPEASVFSLALTCHTLNYLILCRYPFCRFPELNQESKEDFLLLLEKDVGHIYYCHECVRLHSWRSRKRSKGKLNINDRRPCYNKHTFMPPLHPQEGLAYPVARAVMNRHFYGDSHGLSIDTLSTTSGPYTLSHGVLFESKSQARIVEDELYLLTTAEIWNTHGNGPELRRLIDDTKLKLCSHLALGKDKTGSTHRIPEFDLHPARVTDFEPTFNALGSCPVCLTDYTLDVLQHKKKGWVIRLHIHQQLGDCRTPKEWAWQHWVADDAHELQRDDFTNPGSVRSQWSKGDPVEVPAEGDFVPCPPKHGLLGEPVYSRGFACMICRGHAHCQRLRPSTNSSLNTGTTLVSL